MPCPEKLSPDFLPPGFPAPGTRSCRLPDVQATAQAGRWLAGLLRAGDLLALWGDLGAGKTTLARALIQERLAATGVVEEVPSPTFTLVQTYETPCLSVAHFDLYRLRLPEEIHELGLEEALDEGSALVEWPSRLGNLLPDERLDIVLEENGEGRMLFLGGTLAWQGRLANAGEIGG